MNCEYDIICRDCTIDINDFCDECSSIEQGFPVCGLCKGNREIPICKCPKDLVPSKIDRNICVLCAPDEYYDYRIDNCSIEKNNNNIDCVYSDSCFSCKTEIDEFCTECLIRKSDEQLVCIDCKGDLVYVHEENKCRCGDGTFNFDPKST